MARTFSQGDRLSRRSLVVGGAAFGAACLLPTARAGAQGFPFSPNRRYPDPAIEVLNPAGRPYRVFNSTIEQLATGLRWAEGPVWFGDGRYLLLSDIPNNRIVRWDETSGLVSVLRQPSNHSNGLCRDRQGRLLACEHHTRRVTRTEYDGSITVLADRFQGKRFNSPNDLACASDGTIWFTDPAFGISGYYEGDPARAELPHGVYRLDGKSGQLSAVDQKLSGPNGVCLSPDERTLYVVESLGKPRRRIWAYSVKGARVSNKRVFVDAGKHGTGDGVKCDQDGNVWCGWGASGAPGSSAAEQDGVMMFTPDGTPALHIHLPERCANLCFGGPKNNRLFMASSHSLYAVFVNTRGAV